MRTFVTPYGRVMVGSKEEIFAQAIVLAAEAARKIAEPRVTWALTGGSTPQEWYKWCVSKNALPGDVVSRSDFTVSDERCVPLASDQSNFGHAARQLLEPMNVPREQWVPWPVELPPTEAAASYAGKWAARAGVSPTYDICFLGMGDDAHTASIFPGSPLLQETSAKLFTAIEVPGKGWRLTITPAGLAACGLIVVMTLGSAKHAALSRVMTGPYDPTSTPAQLLKASGGRVVWLVDESAAAGLK